MILQNHLAQLILGYNYVKIRLRVRQQHASMTSKFCKKEHFCLQGFIATQGCQLPDFNLRF